jgi:double-strand break repair protein AddB
MMFDTPAPRVFGLPPGVDVPSELVTGLIRRHEGQPPEGMADITLFLNTTRMRRRVQAEFHRHGARFLPRLRLITELADDPLLSGSLQPVSALGRRLELAVLIDRLLRLDPSLAPRSALFDLADSLGALMDEMRGEGVAPQRIAALDVSGHSAHWARAQGFMALVEGFFAEDARPDAEARQRRAVQSLVHTWQAAPPQAPIIVAGSTGSRGTTALLMRAVAGLPQGAVVLPGFDFALPGPVWQGMDDALVHEAHPQFRLGMLLSSLGLTHRDVVGWGSATAPSTERNKLISLALRPAPVTDQWISEGPALGDLLTATEGMTLVEAPSPRHEAMAVALALREAVARGETACLISPDRNLTRRVAAALDRWGLRPDDSAGVPLPQTASGRLLRLVAQAMGRTLAVDDLMVLLKHPLVHPKADRGPHRLLTGALELHLRRHGPPFPDAVFIAAWASSRPEPEAMAWGQWLAGLLQDLTAAPAAPLPDQVRRHRSLSARFAAGAKAVDGAGELWSEEAGAEALAALAEFEAEAPQGFVLTPGDFAQLLSGVLARRQVRSAVKADGRVEILGTQEARIQGADLVVLGGLTEGSWPEMPAPDPWLNRRLRRDAGLLVPERRVGLAAHDFQMAIAAPRVVLTRAHRNAEAETVPSRWLNRLTNLLSGLPAQGGDRALAAMRARGDALLALASRLERAEPTAPAPRPSPRPPVAARPRKLSITAIETLVMDPYEIYARYVLNLSRLNPLRPEADFRLRGEVVHDVLERFLRHDPMPQDAASAAALLMSFADTVLARDVPWPVAREEWRGRLGRIALPFATATLRRESVPVLLEEKAALTLQNPDFVLTGKPDRIDLRPDGQIEVIDYKAGEPPTRTEMKTHRKQLHLAAVMALEGAFSDLGPKVAAQIAYQSMKPGLKVVDTPVTEPEIRQTLAELRLLISAYLDKATGFTARRAALKDHRDRDFDHLARFGEWTLATPSTPEDVG